MANAQPALIDLGSWHNVFWRCSGWAGRPMGVLGAAPLQVHVDVEGKWEGAIRRWAELTSKT